jgi:hypothetical protein
MRLSCDLHGTGHPPGRPLDHHFKWGEDRRAVLRAELDAVYAKLYGLTRAELRCILTSKNVFGLDFPVETFRVLKEKEERLCGEYRATRLGLEAWDKIITNREPGIQPCQDETGFDS